MNVDRNAHYVAVEAERLNLANLITHYWIPRAEFLEGQIGRLKAALVAAGVPAGTVERIAHNDGDGCTVVDENQPPLFDQ